MQKSRNFYRKVKHIRILNKLVKNREDKQKYRIGVYKSLRHFYAYIFDPWKNQVLISVSTLNKTDKYSGNIKAAADLAPELYKKIKEKQLEKTDFVFDRSGYIYHGRVKAFADALRIQGVKF
ncbi:50S ribosomal protein L18 [Mycoplasma flocculare]|uniref:Large ribosomal subunit protein uL18 n=1 Tax=Mesomycoplasma flocculare TaxID=2128 RepID=A0AAW9XGE0_MESFC|nr:50S ribosomal protein L18 [Mesomycoplasma flocculare]MXR05864.1 50S ribosomal protein L18 [Mesomycoplasma flocculare]MXR39455.1 50S ribosomal protein L18 [Mycoplasma sp. MF12]MXR56690.1 50S ribosomal protein L18 [Mesomycoplasma flocculare]